MGLKERVMKCLRAADRDGLAHLVAKEPRAIRYLVGRLWDPRDSLRRLSAQAIGRAAASHNEIGRDLIRRLMWALNDESAMNGVYGLPALGEIGYYAPELMQPFVAPMSSYLWDEGLRLEILRALDRMAESDRGLIEAVRERLETFSTNDPEEARLLAGLLKGCGEEDNEN
jgi:hypothetical protein